MSACLLLLSPPPHQQISMPLLLAVKKVSFSLIISGNADVVYCLNCSETQVYTELQNVPLIVVLYRVKIKYILQKILTISAWLLQFQGSLSK